MDIISEHRRAAGLALVAVTLLALTAIRQLVRPGYRYEKKPLLNKSERGLLGVLNRAVGEAGNGHRLFSQVCYGEFLGSRNTKAFWRINSKRTDFLVVDAEFMPVLAIEYQGTGHYGSNMRSAADAGQRDRVKQQACISAGMAWLEVPARYKRDDIVAQVVAILAPPPEPR
jgi:hypothetical protein